MSKKKSSPSKGVSQKGKNTKKKVQKSTSKKPLIIVAALIAAVALAVILILVCNSDPEINWEKAEANLKGEGYKISNYVTELNGYNGVTKSMSASYSEKESGSLSDYVNAEKEIINFVKFDTEENAELAYEIFCAKFGDKYDKYGVVGDTVYFGTSNAFDIATTIEK